MLNKTLSKIFALTILILFALFITYMLYPYLIPVFLGFTVVYLFYPFYEKINKKTKKPKVSATITIISIILIVMIPLSLLTVAIYDQVTKNNINFQQVQQIENTINNYIDLDISLTQTTQTLRDAFIENLQTYSQRLFSATSAFLLGLFIFFFTLYYALIEHKRFLKLATKYLPFSDKTSLNVLTQSGYAIKALLIGQVLTAIIQGLLGMLSFFIAGIEGALFWGIVMIFLSLIPVVGAFLVWVPAGIILLIQGEVGWAIFIFIWGAVVVSQIDNLIRPYLVNRYFKLHPLIILIGIFAGLTLFGIVGLILGPLIFAFFILLLEAYEKEYIK